MSQVHHPFVQDRESFREYVLGVHRRLSLARTELGITGPKAPVPQPAEPAKGQEKEEEAKQTKSAGSPESTGPMVAAVEAPAGDSSSSTARTPEPPTDYTPEREFPLAPGSLATPPTRCS